MAGAVATIAMLKHPNNHRQRCFFSSGMILLAAIAARDGAALDAALDKLITAGIVFPEGRGL